MEREQHVIKEVKQCVVFTITITVMAFGMLFKQTPDTMRRQACNISQSLNISQYAFYDSICDCSGNSNVVALFSISSPHFTRLRVINFILDKNYSTTSEEEEMNINLL